MEAVCRAGVDPETVDEVVLGAANQAGEDNRNVAQMAMLLAARRSPYPATTYFHSSGACRMGHDDQSVVDAELPVNGIRNFRTADSTIMPRIVSVPNMPAYVLIAFGWLKC